MRRVLWIFVLAVAAVVAAEATSISSLRAQVAPATIPEEVDDAVDAAEGEPVRILLQVESPDVADPETIGERVDEVVAEAPPSVEVNLTFDNLAMVAVSVDSSEELLDLAAIPEVEAISLDLPGRVHLTEVVPLIGASSQHSAGNVGTGVTIAILDSGVDSDHPDFAGRVLLDDALCFGDNDGTIDGSGFCPNGSDRQSGIGAAEDGLGHGTHVAGVAAGDGGVAPVGVSPGASILPVKVASDSGQFFFFSEILAALDELISNPRGVDVINLSLGTFATYPGDCDTVDALTSATASAVSTLRDNGILTVASSGNNGLTNAMALPACLSGVVSVSSSNDGDLPSVSGNVSLTTDVFAPGIGVTGPNAGGGAATRSGTSLSSPAVAGCAALLMTQHPTWSVDEVESGLRTSSIFVRARNGIDYPRVACAPTPICLGLPVTINLAAGESPTSGDDVILGTNGVDLISGGDGNDTICGLEGDDTIAGGPGDDHVDAGPGNDTVLGLSGADHLIGGSGNDALIGSDGPDVLFGNHGLDLLAGGSGDDELDGGDERDRLFALDGDDVVNGGQGDDLALGGEGHDSMTDPGGTNVLNGGDGNDTITGGTGNDTIYGDGTLSQNGNDVLVGGPGADSFFGFNGTDTIDADDGVADLVNAGPNAGDACSVDTADTVFNC